MSDDDEGQLMVRIGGKKLMGTWLAGCPWCVMMAGNMFVWRTELELFFGHCWIAFFGSLDANVDCFVMFVGRCKIFVRTLFLALAVNPLLPFIRFVGPWRRRQGVGLNYSTLRKNQRSRPNI